MLYRGENGLIDTGAGLAAVTRDNPLECGGAREHSSEGVLFRDLVRHLFFKVYCAITLFMSTLGLISNDW